MLEHEIQDAAEALKSPVCFSFFFGGWGGVEWLVITFNMAGRKEEKGTDGP